MIVKGANKLNTLGLNSAPQNATDEDENCVIEYSGQMLPPTVSNFDKENLHTNGGKNSTSTYNYKTPVDKLLKFKQFGNTMGGTCSTLSNSNGLNSTKIVRKRERSMPNEF